MPGSATISVEIELGWGFHDKADPREVAELSDDGQTEREALEWFLDACDDAGVPVTFNVVGHLLLESCDGRHDGPHGAGWFDRDPGTDAETDPLFYAPEVVELIRDADVDHEICTHTFSHVLLDEVSDAVIDWELTESQELHDENVVSLVPPRHRKPPYDVLREHDIEVIRQPVDETPPSSTVEWFLWALTRDHPLDRPQTFDGVVETRTSSFMTLTATYLSSGVSQPHPAYRVLPRRFRKRIHENFLLSGLDAAIRGDSHIHYWTHLYNMAHDAQRQPLRNLLETMAQKEDAEILRMADLRSAHM